MAGVTLQGVDKRFGAVRAVRSVDLDIEDGEFCVLVGPSGCGKSTLLRLIAGLEEPDRGAVLIGGRDVTRVPPAGRGVAMVFQSYALYPHMTAAENITFGLRNTGTEARETADRLARAADMLRLQDLLDRKPAALSGGERQRVAIGRAIVREPSVFLFDEPLSNLDAALRTHMRIEIGRLHKTLATTMVYVTHDQTEAMTMAERIVVLDRGRVEQAGRPLDLYRRPATRFVAGFLGSPPMNFVGTTVERAADGAVGLALAGGVTLSLPCRDRDVAPGDALTLGIRPEDLVLGDGDLVTLPAIVRLVEPLGAETIVHVETVTGSWLVLRLHGLAEPRVGETVRVGLAAASCRLFREDGRALGAPIG